MPHTPLGQAGVQLALQVHASGPRSTHLSSEQGPDDSPPWFAAVFKAPENRSFPLLQRCPPKPMWQDYWTSLSGTILNPYYLGLLRGREPPLPLGSTI